MKPKPPGSKYRNLYAYRGSIWYERFHAGRRLRVDLETGSWEEGAERRDAYEALKGIPARRVKASGARAPTLAEFAKRYLEGDVAHLAATTQSDRKSYLDKDGRLLRHLGERRLIGIDAAVLRAWWRDVIETPWTDAKGREHRRAPATGRHYINVLASVLAYAKDLGILEATPIADFREQLRRRGRTKRGRAQTAPDRNIRPIDSRRELGRLVYEARAEGAEAVAFVLLQLDAGLRQGEALGLKWGRVAWGAGPDDMNRHLVIDATRPRGWDLDDEAPKSGRERRVALSKRLYVALRALYRARFEPGPDALVLVGIPDPKRDEKAEDEEARKKRQATPLDPSNFRHREWRRILERAGIGHRAMKDLRDTFASQLLTAGVQLGYVSAQLGHADVTVTSRHYARWCGGDGYRAPVLPRAGELPADILARIAPELAAKVPTEVPTTKTAERLLVRNRSAVLWNLERETGVEPATLSLGS